MDKKYIEDNEIEIKYLRNQLNDEELEAFEIYLMEHPAALDSIDVSDLLDQMPDVDAEKRATPIFDFKVSIWLAKLKLVSPYAVAFIFGGILLPLFKGQIVEKDFVSMGLANQQVLESSLRGQSDPLNQFSINRASRDFLSLVIVTGDFLEKSYQIDVYRLDANNRQRFFSQENVQSNTDGELTLVIPISSLSSTDYFVEVAEEDGAWSKSYQFSVLLEQK
jgi:hypothetical protein